MSDFSFLNNALLVDGNGQLTNQNKLLQSHDFAEIRHWSDQVYMPYHVEPLCKPICPQSTLHALNIGSMVISRFTYGIPVHLRKFSMEAGVGMVLTTLNGTARHHQNTSNCEETCLGGSFIVDNSRTEYCADFSENHLQLNVTFNHDYLAGLYKQLTGHYAGPDFWQNKVKFGATNNAWLKLLDYVVTMVTMNNNTDKNSVMTRHLEELIGTNILIQWASASGFDLENTANNNTKNTAKSITPGYVIKAENYIRDNASKAPTLSDIALVCGVSGRTLHKAFKKYRNTTPMSFLRDVRLEGVRAELQKKSDNITISEIVYSWGYASLGRFANAYRLKFGELPSETHKKRY